MLAIVYLVRTLSSPDRLIVLLSPMFTSWLGYAVLFAIVFSETGLLVRFLRYSESFVGRTPTQIDYSDYRDVGGIKMPFKWTVGWLDGKENFEITDIQNNVAIDPAKFGKPKEN